MMDAKEAIERLNEFVWQQSNGYSIYIANGGQDNDEFELLMDDLKLAISALEKVETIEAENARLQKYNDTLIAYNNLLRNELDAQDLLSHDDDVEFAEVERKIKYLEAENARMLAMLKHFAEHNNCSACPILKFCKEQKELITCKDVILAYVNGQALKIDKE